MTEQKRFGVGAIAWIPAAAVVLTQALSLSCGNKQSGMSADDARKILADVIIQNAMIPTQNAIVWTADGQGNKTSHWVRGNALKMDYGAARRDLVIPVGGALWQWRETSELQAVCDCEAWEIAQWQGQCPEKEDPASAVKVDMVDLVSGTELELFRARNKNTESELELSEYSSSISPTASVGPYLFVKYSEEWAFCRSDGKHQSEGYTVFDLQNKKAVDVLSKADKEQIETVERKAAFESMKGMLGPKADSSDVELVTTEPRYDAGFNLTIFYVFGARATGDKENVHAYSYSESVSMPGRTIPEALADFALPPAVVNTFGISAAVLGPGGWGLVVGSDEQMAALWLAFAKE